MEEKDKAMLQNVLKLSEENNRMLKRMERRHFWSSVGRLFYWVIIIGAAYGAFYYVQPYLAKVTNMYNVASSQLQKVQNVTDTVSDTVNKYVPVKK